MVLRASRPIASLATAILLLFAAVPARAAGPALGARVPAQTPTSPERRTGVLTLSGGAFAYLPKANDGRPRPLLVAFYGAGGQAANVLDQFRDDADRDGFVLLIPTSRASTWDMIRDLQSRLGIEMNVQPRYGRDLKNLDLALADLFARVAVDPTRVGVMGFSDGATYALSVGTANPALFTHVIAFSPGPAFVTRYDKQQRIFVSHGENDNVLPYSTTRGNIARLRVKGMKVEFRSFPGGHSVPDDIRTRAMGFFRNEPAPAPAD